MVKRVKLLIFLSFIIPQVLMGKPIDTVYRIKENTTMYSLPGYTYSNFKEFFDKPANGGQSQAEKLESFGLQDMIPKKLAWPIAGDQIKVVDDKSFQANGKDFLYVEFKKPNGNVIHGWVIKDVLEATPKSQPHGTQQLAIQREDQIAAARSERQANQDCEECNTKFQNQFMGLELNMFQDMNKTFSNHANSYRSLDEIDSYTRAFRKGCMDKYHNAFSTEYKKYIKEAAEAFEIPVSLLACSLFVESQWNKDAASGVGAVGLGQFMPNTAKTVTDILTNANMSQSRVRELEGFVQKYQTAVAENLEREKKGLQPKQIPRQVRKDFEYSEKKLYNYSLSLKWGNYFDKLQNFKPFQQNYNVKNPTAFSYGTGARLPANAIGAAALYYRYLFDFVDGEVPIRSVKSNANLTDLLVSVTGAYNMGPGGLAKAVSRSKSTDPSKWKERMAAVPETKKHMENIARCMKKSPHQPQVEFNNRNQMVPQRACSN